MVMDKIDKQLINRIDTQLTKREIKYARKLARELNKTFDEIIIRIETTINIKKETSFIF